MAALKAVSGTKVLVQIEDPLTPGTYAHPCLINAARGISFTSNTSDQLIPDCLTPDAPAWITRTKDGLSASVTGAGLLHTPDTEVFFDWFKGDTAKNVRVKIDALAADGGGYFAFSAKLTEFNITGDRGAKAEADVTILSDGAVTWTDATP